MAKGPSNVGANGAFNHGAIADLTGGTGTVNSALADVTASPTQALVNENFNECATKINAILQVLRDRGDIA